MGKEETEIFGFTVMVTHNFERSFLNALQTLVNNGIAVQMQNGEKMNAVVFASRYPKNANGDYVPSNNSALSHFKSSKAFRTKRSQH